MINATRLSREMNFEEFKKFEAFYKARKGPQIPLPQLNQFAKVFFEVGAGTGHFFSELARENKDTYFIAVERDRMRGNALAAKAKRLQHPNFLGLRGNIIPSFLNELPDESLDQIFILYPCPWPKSSQRKHRWYLHAAMKHFVRTLKRGGNLVWASDQEFYIEEAEYVSRNYYPLTTEKVGTIAPNSWNYLTQFPSGRTKFEQHFLAAAQPCFELISKKV